MFGTLIQQPILIQYQETYECCAKYDLNPATT